MIKYEQYDTGLTRKQALNTWQERVDQGNLPIRITPEGAFGYFEDAERHCNGDERQRARQVIQDHTGIMMVDSSTNRAGLPLNVSRAADRDAMLDRIMDICDRLPGVTTTPLEYPQQREVGVEIAAPGGLCVRVEFDGDSRQQRDGVWVLAWHLALDSGHTLSDLFRVMVKDHNTGRGHPSKCTTVAYGFDSLRAQVAAGLAAAVSGATYRDEATT